MNDTLKHHSRESFSSVVERLANLAIDEKPLSDEAIHGIEEALVDIKKGRLHSEEEIVNYPHLIGVGMFREGYGQQVDKEA